MTGKALIPLYGDEVAPRFDQATEVWIGRIAHGGRVEESKTMVLPQASAEDLCHLVLTEGVDMVVCGGIEEEYYDYLRWKRIEVFDSVMGFLDRAVEALRQDQLKSGAVLFERRGVR